MAATVRSTNVRALLRALDAVGLPGDELAREVGLDPASLVDPERYLSATCMSALFRLATTRDPSSDLGLRLGAAVPRGAFDVADYILAVCETVADALSLCVRLAGLGTTISGLRLVRQPGHDARLESVLYVPATDIHPQTRDYVFSAHVHRLRSLHPRFAFRAVELRGPRNAEPARYAELLGAPTTFDHAHSALVIPEHVLALRIEGADATLRGILERHAQHLASKAPTQDLIDHARHELSVMLGQGQAEIAVLARRLAVSTRTLQRRLTERGLPYSTLLDEARRDLALGYLANEEASVDEVAAVLGYSEPSAFARAFRRWLGCSPAKWRRAQRRVAASGASGSD